MGDRLVKALQLLAALHYTTGQDMSTQAGRLNKQAYYLLCQNLGESKVAEFAEQMFKELSNQVVLSSGSIARVEDTDVLFDVGVLRLTSEDINQIVDLTGAD